MLQSLLHIKLAAMVAALGLDTKEWTQPSKEMTAEVQKLADSMLDLGKPEKSSDVQTSINATLKEIQALADEKGDKDALFAMGLFSQQSKEQGALEKAMDYYKRAAGKGQLQATNNLGFLIAGTSKDPDKQKEGVALIKKAADAGNNPARRNMAMIYLNALGGETRDVAKAEALLKQAASEKDADAAYALSQFYMGQGGKDKQNDEAGWSWLNEAAKGGNANALDTLGTLYFQGGKIGSKAIDKDEKKAVEQFKLLAEANNPVGLRKMATLWEAGVGGEPRDFAKAFEAYKRSAQGNDAFAQFRLGSMYDQGVKESDKADAKILVAPDAATALSLYRMSAQNGLPIAAYYTGAFYEQGRAVDRDLSKAFTFYMAAAQNGIAVAMQKVGDFYLNGAPPLMKDPVAAQGWYAHSAEAGLPEGYLSEGFMVENGLGPSANKDNRFFEAADYYSKATDSPNASDAVRLAAFIRLGGLFYRGVMVPKNESAAPDYSMAYIYFQQAYDVDAKNQVAGAARDEVLKKIDPSKKASLDQKISDIRKDRQARIDKKRAEAASGAAPTAEPVTEPAATTPGTTKRPGTTKKPK